MMTFATMSACVLCGKRATYCCSGLDVPALPFCDYHAMKHADTCANIRDGQARLVSAKERPAMVAYESWAGRTEHRVVVIGETPKRYIARWDEEPLHGRRRGDVFRPPKRSVRFVV